jgi:hypothetical protein
LNISFPPLAGRALAVRRLTVHVYVATIVEPGVGRVKARSPHRKLSVKPR